MSYNYNTLKKKLILREYGRNVQQLASYISTIKSKEERTEASKVLVLMMSKLNPNRKENHEYEQKLWGDVIIASDYKLDIETPHEIPIPEKVPKKTIKVPYQNSNLKYKHYGNNIKKLLKAVAELEEGEKRDVLIDYIAQLMKTMYKVWNKNSVENQVILKNISEMSQNKIEFDADNILNKNIKTLYDTNETSQRSNNTNNGRNNGNNRMKKKPYSQRSDNNRSYGSRPKR